MISKAFSIAALAACLAGAVPALAGFIATTGTNTVQNENPDGSPDTTPPPVVGDKFSVPAGTFSAYVPDGPSDPQLEDDLPAYGYNLTGTITSVDLVTETITYLGNYEITYTFNPGSGTVVVPVSTGDAAFTAVFVPGTNNAVVTGTLTETEGPQGPYASSFTDIGTKYSGNPVDIDATYIGGTTDYSTGTIEGTLTQTATAVPEPAVITCLPLLGLAGFRRARRQQA